ncbi:MAG: sulfatase-like hydrolase/transferase [Leptospirales bacterium]|nr:sulfatase-like hydrolase/transferase [Leptospirales bacterium]
MLKELQKNKIKIISAIVLSILTIILLNIVLSNIWKLRFIYPHIKTGYTVIIIITLIVYITSIFQKLKLIGKIIKYAAIISASLSILIIILLTLWYNYIFFPDDEDYLKDKVNAAQYTNNDLYEVEIDLIRTLKNAKISSKLEKSDRDFLLNPEFKASNIYIDYNSYNSTSPNNLKYATGKTFYYVYQKNCAVIKGNSNIEFSIPDSTQKRLLELDAVLPDLDKSVSDHGEFSIKYTFTNGETITLINEAIKKEVKPDIEAFRYSSVLSSIWFYLKNPGRSIITDDTGWKKIKVDIPSKRGTLTLNFKTDNDKTENKIDKDRKNYLFLGTPRIYSAKENKKNNHYNVVYIIFDILGQPHIDLYEYYDEFLKNGFDNAVYNIGEKNILTKEIDSYYNNIILFDHVITAGQVTRPAVVSLWTSQFSTKARIPVFRNIITLENQREFHEQGFTSLGEKLSAQGYFTKQIECNANSHNVSGVGVDLGFDENHDYTIETSTYPANIKHIINFLEENQNRKFLLYAHLNIPHPPKWIPMKYFTRELNVSDYDIETAKLRGNIKYVDFNFKMIMDTIKKLNLDENTFVIITADHSSGDGPGFRKKPSRQLKAAMERGRDSQSVATFHPNAIYVRGGSQHLFSDYMQVPFIVIPPKTFKTKIGRVNSYISTIDVAPTILDILQDQKEKLLAGKSFKYLIENPANSTKVHTDFIPMVGRFSGGFILDGKYKYWWDITGLYKYRTRNDGLKYIQKPEHLFDLETDPYETTNLANDERYKTLLNRMRDIRFNRYQDYDEKNFIQIAPDKNTNGDIKIHVKSKNGVIVYPTSDGENIKIIQKRNYELEIDIANSDKFRFISFETKPDKTPIEISIYRDSKLIEKSNIFSGKEKINLFNNPIILKDKNDFYITSIPGRLGYEESDIPEGSVYFYRIPLIYWLEMSRSERDINLSPGIKEVLKGWGYIQ